MSDFRLRVEGVEKSFPGLKALRNVSFAVRPGTVHALCGENGAGKSTLMKIINGLYQPDAGEIYLDEKPIKVKSPIQAHALGIAMIAQELNYVPQMTIAENFFLGRLPMKAGRVDWKFIRSEARQIIDREGLPYSVDQKLSTLTVSDIQMLEIERAIYHKADVLIMDEPTSAIAHQDVENLFRKIEVLRSRGVAIIYISHKMDEVFRIADDITILRDGQVVSTDPAAELDLDEVIARMVGRKLENQYPKEEVPLGDVVLKVSDLHREHTFTDINLHVRAGEIVGLAGLVGAGRSETIQSIFGLDPLDGGVVRVNGKDVTISNPQQAIRNGLALLSEDRRLMGIVPILSIKRNATLASLQKVIHGGRAHPREEDALVTEYFTAMAVKAPGLETPIQSLSGGNQQKVLLAKWLLADPEVLLLDEPTRGIDVGAKFEIYRLMTKLAQEGKGLLMVSSELPELIGMCDRIYVMSAGRLTGEIPRAEFSQERILAYAMNQIPEIVQGESS
ncbi:sugar ABC transporter ATP-binding protein [Raineyella sp.]|uniref:sugar ABC transporter ATP-binding protein n=1 Tax=Raineyella sp. TaxID=1911550 RepID=UPI002B1F98C0|nr:sugar ABC transporter ATP-binding protein [Raineyella sp.]MEA5154305.1 sugar ABC transporter ATP-binding protein [Raineyella sp.]